MSEEYISFPVEYDRRKLNSLYREIPLKDTASRMLRKYFNAMSHLYGIIPLEKAWEIIHNQCPRMISEAEFWAFAGIAQHECEDFFILGEDALYADVRSSTLRQREIVDAMLFLLDEELYYRTKDNQQGKPYYIPEKQELLRYSAPHYWESTPEREKLTEFCTKKLKMSEQDRVIAFLEINEKIRYLSPDPNVWLPDWESAGLWFSTEKQMETFITLYQDAFNNGRMQCNRGYTPLELRDMNPPEERIPEVITLGPNIRKAITDGSIDADEMRAHIFSMDLPSEELRLNMLLQIAEIEAENRPQKVSRNAPCPCGSGRKYKNCCGKK